MRFVMGWTIEMVCCSTYVTPTQPRTTGSRYHSLVVAKCLETPGKLGPGIRATAEEVGGILVAWWAESICRLFKPEVALRER